MSFQQVGGLVTKNVSVLCLYLVALYFKSIKNQLTFIKEFPYIHKGISLHPILVRIIGSAFIIKYEFPEKFEFVEALVRKCSVEKAFLEILQNSEETTCARVSFLINL